MPSVSRNFGQTPVCFTENTAVVPTSPAPTLSRAAKRLLGHAMPVVATALAGLPTALAAPGATLSFRSPNNDTLGDASPAFAEYRPSIGELWDAISSCDAQQLSGLPPGLVMHVLPTQELPGSEGMTVRVSNITSTFASCLGAAANRLSQKLIDDHNEYMKTIHREDGMAIGLGIGIPIVLMLSVCGFIVIKHHLALSRVAPANVLAGPAAPVPPQNDVENPPVQQST